MMWAPSMGVPEVSTRTGWERAIVVPSPSCPSALFPQANTLPSSPSASVWSAPAEISTMCGSNAAAGIVTLSPPEVDPCVRERSVVAPGRSRRAAIAAHTRAMRPARTQYLTRVTMRPFFPGVRESVVDHEFGGIGEPHRHVDRRGRGLLPRREHLQIAGGGAREIASLLLAEEHLGDLLLQGQVEGYRGGVLLLGPRAESRQPGPAPLEDLALLGDRERAVGAGVNVGDPGRR